jgi:NAD(P)-dependent dehydrogenase (short-subunit alcohol dehydrogenase family)
MFQTALMSGQRILVTGGGTGLGQAMSERFLELGADVAICGRRKSVCDETAAVWRSRFPERRIDTFGVDIRRADEVEHMVETLWQDGGLTGLVNNAAGNFIAPTESLSPRAFDAVANIVFHGTFYVTQAVGKRWVAEAKAGTWQPGIPVPERDEHHRHLGRQRLALRRALGDEQGRRRVMTKSLAIEWAGHGIRLNAVGPGEIPTEGMSKRSTRRGARRPQPRPQPDGRGRRMSELQNLATFLLAPGPVRLADRAEHHDGRRQRDGHWRQLLRAAQLERRRLAGSARAHRGPEPEGQGAALRPAPAEHRGEPPPAKHRGGCRLQSTAANAAGKALRRMPVAEVNPGRTSALPRMPPTRIPPRDPHDRRAHLDR